MTTCFLPRSISGVATASLPVMWGRGFFLLPAVLLASGCALPMERKTTLDQQQRESVAGKTAADVTDRTISKPAHTTVEVPQDDGKAPVRVSIAPVEEANRTAVVTAGEVSLSSASGSWTDSVKLPLAVAILMTAVAFAMFVAVWILWSKLSKTGAATDAAVASHETKLMSLVNDALDRVHTVATAPGATADQVAAAAKAESAAINKD